MPHQSAFSRQVEGQSRRIDAVLRDLGHVCKTHAADPTNMAAALSRHAIADVNAAVEQRIRQPHDPFEGIV